MSIFRINDSYNVDGFIDEDTKKRPSSDPLAILLPRGISKNIIKDEVAKNMDYDREDVNGSREKYYD